MSTTPQTTPQPAAPVPLTPAAQPFAVENPSPEEEGKYLNYVGHQIPWYVRLLWLIFWIASAWYVIRLLLPALDAELLSPP